MYIRTNNQFVPSSAAHRSFRRISTDPRVSFHSARISRSRPPYLPLTRLLQVGFWPTAIICLHRESKKQDTKLLPIASPNVNRFSKLLLEHCDFLNIDISQGSAGTYLMCGGIFKYQFVANLPVSLPLKEFWKSVNIWGSYGQEFSVLFFWLTV